MSLIIPAQLVAVGWGYSNATVVPSVRGPCELDRDYTIAYFLVNHDEKMNPIDFEGHWSKVKVTMNIYRNNLVNTIET